METADRAVCVCSVAVWRRGTGSSLLCDIKCKKKTPSRSLAPTTSTRQRLEPRARHTRPHHPSYEGKWGKKETETLLGEWGSTL